MADGALGQFVQNVSEGIADETKKTVKAAGTQLGVIKPKSVKVPTQQQIDARAAQAKVQADALLAQRRAELNEISTPQVSEQPPASTATPTPEQKRHEQAAEYMKQEAFATAQRLGQAPRQEAPRREEALPETKTPPPLEQVPSKGLFGVKKKPSNTALVDAQRRTEVKSGKLG